MADCPAAAIAAASPDFRLATKAPTASVLLSVSSRLFSLARAEFQRDRAGLRIGRDESLPEPVDVARSDVLDSRELNVLVHLMQVERRHKSERNRHDGENCRDFQAHGQTWFFRTMPTCRPGPCIHRCAAAIFACVHIADHTI